jgi:hypothetical protein
MAYLRAQEQIVSELIKSVRDVLPKHVRLNLIPTVQRPTAGLLGGGNWIDEAIRAL